MNPLFRIAGRVTIFVKQSKPLNFVTFEEHFPNSGMAGFFACLINAVISMGRRNTSGEPDLRWKQRPNRSLVLDQPEHKWVRSGKNSRINEHWMVLHPIHS